MVKVQNWGYFFLGGGGGGGLRDIPDNVGGVNSRCWVQDSPQDHQPLRQDLNNLQIWADD